MGQHKIQTPDKPKVPKTHQKTINWPDPLWQRMLKARDKMQVPVVDAQGQQVGLRKPEMSECYLMWVGTMMDLIDHATQQHERSQAMVLTPAELTARGAKLPLDLMRRS